MKAFNSEIVKNLNDYIEEFIFIKLNVSQGTYKKLLPEALINLLLEKELSVQRAVEYISCEDLNTPESFKELSYSSKVKKTVSKLKKEKYLNGV
ncbi:hypothetical protein [Exiguobacterium sp. K1]|uniref:hypothetical protein n=1 Tax=Exiguobacterium sp. K1 TaxID=2980105 RepID=UPI00299D95E4|nr:hypothetical protein [Exiguobacterium sp. K1]MDX1259993.1 hypothetical protein [Exiguobacterium sp. K1]